jgi:hypothetical protein
MTYELAKKLKDAGFYQSEYRIGNRIYKKGNEGLAEYGAYIPTLSELIEACGEEFISLNKEWKYKWQAFGKSDKWGGFEFGSIPEEAVALLWIALNKK